jgi:hypothetical protein
MRSMSITIQYRYGLTLTGINLSTAELVSTKKLSQGSEAWFYYIILVRSIQLYIDLQNALSETV